MCCLLCVVCFWPPKIQNTDQNHQQSWFWGVSGPIGGAWGAIGHPVGPKSPRRTQTSGSLDPPPHSWRPKCIKNRSPGDFCQYFVYLWLLVVKPEKKPTKLSPLNPRNRDYRWTVVQKQHVQVSRESIKNELQK